MAAFDNFLAKGRPEIVPLRWILIIITVCFAQGDHLPINWTKASTVGFGISSHYEDPAVKPLAPCPCDYTSSHCDAICCCDEDCSTQTAPFSCSTGLQGGQKTDKNIDYNCKYQGPYSPEWHDMLCFVGENNPYLGHFFKNEPSIQNYQKYIDRVNNLKYSYEDTEIHIEHEDIEQYYSFGSDIQIAVEVEDLKSNQLLLLPHPVLSGVCVDTPVQFLKDVDHKCYLRLTPEVCEAEMSLNLNSYLSLSGHLILTSDNKVLQVIANLTSNELIHASVAYECLEDVSQFLKAEGLYTFPEYLSKSEVIPYSECNSPKVPNYNESSQMCENVVLYVEYIIKWKGASLKEVHANIKLGAVPVSLANVPVRYLKESSNVEKKKVHGSNQKVYKRANRHHLSVSKTSNLYLAQHFKVNFHYINSSSNNSVSYYSENGTLEDLQALQSFPSLTDRSGNPGYQRGKPLLIGYANYETEEFNSTSDPLMFIDIGEDTGLFVMSPGEECLKEKTERICFGVDMLSACLHTWNGTISCSGLRNQVNATISSLVKGNLISKFGWPNTTLEKEFLPIIWSQEKMEEPNKCIIPTYLEYEIIYQDTLDNENNQLNVYQITGCYIRLYYEDLVYDPHLSSGSLYLTTAVKFIKSKRPSKLSRFWKSMEDRWCHGGTCWHEILQPWTHGKHRQGGINSSIMYSTSLIELTINTALMFVIFTPVLFLIIQHRYKVRI